MGSHGTKKDSPGKGHHSENGSLQRRQRYFWTAISVQKANIKYIYKEHIIWTTAKQKNQFKNRSF